MPNVIDYHFTLLSPWTYLGHSTFIELARRHHCTVVYKPVPLRSVFDETGGLPLPKRHPVRQRYRMFELQRWRLKRGLPLVLQPKHFPFDVSLADRLVIAIVQAGGDPGRFVGDVLAGVWARDEDMSRVDLLSGLLADSGFEAQAIIAAAQSDDVKAIYDAAIGEAVAAGVFGAPSYVRGSEVFWGQDRLELLADALESSRAPFNAEG